MKFYLLAAVTIVMVVQAVKATDLEDTVSLLLLSFFTILSLQRQKKLTHTFIKMAKKYSRTTSDIFKDSNFPWDTLVNIPCKLQCFMGLVHSWGYSVFSNPKCCNARHGTWIFINLLWNKITFEEKLPIWKRNTFQLLFHFKFAVRLFFVSKKFRNKCCPRFVK